MENEMELGVVHGITTSACNTVDWIDELNLSRAKGNAQIQVTSFGIGVNTVWSLVL